jgi:glycerate dehydrogenase
LEALCNLTVYPRTAPEQILERAQGAQILITNKTLLTRETLDHLPDLQAVCLLSTGTNTVDLEACRERGIPVCNIPAYSTASVAEHTFALLLAWARQVETHHQAVRDREWVEQEDFCFTLTPQIELAGKTLGILGFGDIGQAVTRMAIAFGMKVLVHTPHPGGKPDLGQQFVEEATLLASSDVLSMHCPLNTATQGWVNAERLARMRPGAVLINTGRGGLVVEEAVAAALASGHLGAALLDVLSTEPPAPDNPLLSAPRCWITPHLAWATRAARGRLIEVLASNLQAFLQGCPRNVVNRV